MCKVQRIHFIGIGGSGMSGIAEVLITKGYKVSGSDLSEGKVVARLRALGAKVFIGQAAENIADVDIVVVSTAIAADNPELVAAREKHLPILPRAQMLAELMRFNEGIAIAGTHGKTTTTSLVASILAEGGLDPTFVIGGLLQSAGANARLGSGKYFVAEADESDASFLRLQPLMSVVTNIDPDHMQTYGHDFNNLKQAFVDFLHNLPFYGLAVVCVDHPVVRELLPKIERPIVTYGMHEDAEVRALDVKMDGMTSTFTVKRAYDRPDLQIKLNMAGEHNVLNALAAIAIADACKVSDAAIVKALAEFHGVGRRMQIHGEMQLPKGGKALIIEDYGHHPQEIEVTLKAMRQAWPQRRLVLAFQPHRYTRTRDLFDEFAQVISEADLLLLLEVYSAGEKPLANFDSQALARNIRQRGKVDPIYVADLEKFKEILPDVLQDEDVVLLQGAGSVGKMGEELVGL